MINPSQYASLVLEPALRDTKTYSLDAMYLMMITALVESKLVHLRQLPDGPALGLFQVEPMTYLDVVRYCAERNNELGARILEYCNLRSFPVDPNILIHNLALNALIARVKYWMRPEPIPSYKDVEGQARYWKQYYNTNLGAGSVEDFVKHAETVKEWINHDDEQESKG